MAIRTPGRARSGRSAPRLIWRDTIERLVTHVRMVVLGSSSSGNSTLVETGDGSVLVDAGFSCRELTRRLSVVGSDVGDLRAVLLTHEHTDHVSGVRVMARRYDLPVIASPGTVKGASRQLAGLDVRPVTPGEPFEVNERARAVLVGRPAEAEVLGTVLVVSAGTSDIPVAEEAAFTARALGSPVKTVFDVGVSGLHRLLTCAEDLARASVVVVVAGMEGALASVVGGLVSCPVVAVPTSVGYGASFKGLAALLAMLNSCAANVAVVNIDDGFGAGYVAGLMNRLNRGERWSTK